MIPHIELKKGKQKYLLIRDDASFHIIDGNENLTAEKRRLILKRCPAPSEMQAMGLSGMSIAIADLEGVAVYGIATGDEISFHLQKKKIRWELDRRYEQHYLDDFFRGVPRIPTPAKRKVKGKTGKDWRTGEQDTAVRKTMNQINLYLNWFAGIVLVGMLIFEKWYDLLSVLGFLCTGAAVYLCVVHQEYFTFMDSKTYKKSGGRAKVQEPWLAFFPLWLVLLRGLSRFLFFELLVPWSYGLIAGGVIGLVLIFLTEDLKRNLGAGFCALLVSVFLCAGIVMQGNHLLAGEPFVTQRAAIVDMYVDSAGKGPTEYNCVVCFSDGRQLTVDVGSRAEYEKYEIGGELTIPIRTGGFGMEYGIYGYEP